VPDAYVYHHHPETLMTMLKKKFWMGYWRVPLYKKHSKKLFRHSYTPKTVFAGVALLAATIIFSILNILGVLPIDLTIYFLALTFLLTLPLSIKIFIKDKLVGILSPWIIILRNLATALGILAGIVYVLTRRS
jgi:hypothetical protein